MRKLIAAIVTVLVLVGLAKHAFASVPPEINYQGILTDAAGDTVPPGTYTMRFRIYDEPTAGNLLWESFDDDPYVPVAVLHGLFNHLLGSSNPLPDSLVKYDSLWLGVRRGSDEPEMDPRTKLVSVMYAMKTFVAETALQADSATFATSASHADSADYADSAGMAAYADSAGNAQSSVYADTAVYADTVIFIDPSASYRRIALDHDIDSVEDATVEVSTVSIPDSVVTSFIRLEAAIWTQLYASQGNAQCNLELLIGEVGSEVSVYNQRIALAGQSGVSAVNGVERLHLFTYYYEPTQDEKDNGFNVRMRLTASDTGGSSYAIVVQRRVDIYGL